jgi:thiol-disulfide isomerase/thioredoxin
VSWKTLARNGVLAVLAGSALTAGLSGRTPSAVSWIGNLGGTSVLVPILVVTLLVFAAAGVMGFLSLLRSYGRVLLRVDDLERRLTAAGVGGGEILSTQTGLGHAPGTVAPAFTATDTNESVVSLSDLLAPRLPLLLLFTSPECGPCKVLLPEIAAWQQEHGYRLTIAIANGGNRQESIVEARNHGLERVLEDGDLAIYKSYEGAGTPGAVLIAPNGTIASYLAVGSDSIRQLLDTALAGRGDNEEPVLPVGSLLPSLILPGLNGEPVDIAGIREKTLMLFWNPDCGFCRSMGDDLRAWERHKPASAPRLVIISSGDEASVRAEGFLSTVTLDPDFSAGVPFGAGGTPMAILVDNEGRIASQLGAGAEAVFALAGGRSPVDLSSDVLTAKATR